MFWRFQDFHIKVIFHVVLKLSHRQATVCDSMHTMNKGYFWQLSKNHSETMFEILQIYSYMSQAPPLQIPKWKLHISKFDE